MLDCCLGQLLAQPAYSFLGLGRERVRAREQPAVERALRSGDAAPSVGQPHAFGDDFGITLVRSEAAQEESCQMLAFGMRPYDVGCEKLLAVPPGMN